MTCNSTSGPTEICPEKGPLCEAMSTMETAMSAVDPVEMKRQRLLSRRRVGLESIGHNPFKGGA